VGRRHWIVASGGTLAAFLIGAGAASAHIEPDPVEVQAGLPVTIEFRVEHGCDDADTTGMLFEVPPGVTDLEPVAKDGWTTSVDDGVAAFTDGVLDHHTEDTFALSFTAPSSAGPIDFPVVQQCGDTELRWIEIQQDGAEEPENPAPRVNVVGEAPAVDTTANAPATTPAATVPSTTTESTGAPTTSAPSAEATTTSVELVIAPAPETTVDDAATGTDPGDGDDGSSSSGWVIVAAIAVVGTAAGGGYLYWSRSRSAP
jgi:periplasmic copper chaperone A